METITKNYKDFDEFFAEMEQKPALEIKLYGKLYSLPSEIPASFMLDTFKLYKAGVQSIPEAKQMEMAVVLLGEENVVEWCEKGMTMNQLAAIMKWSIEQMNKGAGNQGKK